MRPCDSIKLSISIHSPHTRGDRMRIWLSSATGYFNPLPSHEGRLNFPAPLRVAAPFQSTPLTRGETPTAWSSGAIAIFQSTPLTRGETLQIAGAFAHTIFQSTPLTRGETFVPSRMRGVDRFQSTPLTRGETPFYSDLAEDKLISIHSPHTRGDIMGG